MSFPIESQVYTPGEIAAASGVDERLVREAVGAIAFVGHAEAVDLAVRLRRRAREQAVLDPEAAPDPFARLSANSQHPHRLPFAASGSVHLLALVAGLLVGSFQVGPSARSASTRAERDEAQLVFLNLSGPGGGGGGGGRRDERPVPKALRRGTNRLNSPLPTIAPPPPAQPVEPPPLGGETFPVLNAPVIAAPADRSERDGALETTAPPSDSHGTGTVEGVGSGAGHGLGAGTGSGIGDGSGGGIGGGPFRPGAGITPPLMLHEVKATYTEEARRAGVTGEVLLEVVVKRTGSVGSIRLLRGLGVGLDQRAIDAVRQWSFAPATRNGTPVDVIVEVSVEFSLR